MKRDATRWAALIGAVVMVTDALSVVQFAGGAPASAVSRPQTVSSRTSQTNSLSPKTMVVLCPPGKRVIGGGGWVQEIGDKTHRLALTQLRPVRLFTSTQDGYAVTAAETTPGTTNNWWVQAYAICADPLPGLHIVAATTNPSSSAVQATAAVCPAGQRVIGTGGRISTSGGEVVLQVARASRPGDIARIQAHEDADGYASNWYVTSYAVCVNTPARYEVVSKESTQRESETEKIALATCPPNTYLHGSGAAITNTAPGNVSLQGIYPYSEARQTQALAVENTPTSQNWDFIVATAICAA